MTLGEQMVVDGTLYEVVALGHFEESEDDENPDPHLVVDEGRDLVEQDPDMLVLVADEDPRQAIVLENADRVEARRRRSHAELEIDSRLGRARQVLLSYEGVTDGVPLSVAAALMRSAYAQGVADTRMDPSGGAWIEEYEMEGASGG